MVKTKVLVAMPIKKKSSPKAKGKQGDKKIIRQNLFEAKALKKGQYRDKTAPFYLEGEEEPGKPLPEGMNNGWWQSMGDGENCRTLDSNKVHAAISMSINEGKGLNIQGIPEGKNYVWYMTRIFTQKEQQKPSKQATQYPNSKGKKK